MGIPHFSTRSTRNGHPCSDSAPFSAPAYANHLPPDPAAAIRQEAAAWAERVCQDDATGDDATAETGGTLTASPSPSGGAPDAKTLVRDYRPRWEQAFLAALAVEGVVSHATDAAGIDRTTPYQHRAKSPRFHRLWDEALARSRDLARKEVFTRGVIGWHEPVFFGGECIGHDPKKSDRCLELYLKPHDPAYRDKVDLTHAAPDGRPVRTQAEITAQLAPYESAVAMMIDAAIALRAWKRCRPLPSLPRSASPALGATSRGRTPTARSATAPASCR